MEIDFPRSEKITLQKRIKCLEEQVCIFSFIVYTRNKKFFIKVSDKTFRWNFLIACQLKKQTLIEGFVNLLSF